MEGDNVTFIVPSCSTVPDIPPTAQIIEEGPRVCPLCSSEVRLFYINFNEKMLMCENTECEYPFGYEELQFVCVEGAEHSDTVSIRTKHMSSSASGSVISTSAWSEIDKLNKVFDSEDGHHEKTLERKTGKKKRTRKVLNKNSMDQIQKNVSDIRGLNMELIELSREESVIKNEKWINKLKSLSGDQFLRPQEIDQWKKKKYKLNNKELKINIQPGDYTNTISSIKIDITDKTE